MTKKNGDLVRRVVIGSVCVCAIVSLSAQTGSPGNALTLLGAAIQQENIDGVIGEEWDDAGEYSLDMGRYQAKLFLKHDGTYFYVAMEIYTGEQFAGGFEAYIFIDNGDDIYFNEGDDILSVKASDGVLVEADFYYREMYDFEPDILAGGTCDAHGAGKYDSESGCYVFEFVRTLSTQDARDVSMNVRDGMALYYGWAGSNE